MDGFSSPVTAAGRLVTLWFGVTNRQVASSSDAAVAPLLLMSEEFRPQPFAAR
jgi:hypothetical protein